MAQLLFVPGDGPPLEDAGVDLFDHFISLVSPGNTGWSASLAGGTGTTIAALAAPLGDVEHPGVLVIRAGTAATTRATLHRGLTVMRLPAGVPGAELIIDAVVQAPLLASATNDYFLQLGVSNNIGAGFPTQGIIFRYQFPNPNWAGVVRQANVDVDVQTGPAVVAGQWTRLRIEYKADEGLRYFIASPDTGPLVQVGALVPLALVDPLAMAGAFAPQVKIQKTVGGLARDLYLDSHRTQIKIPR